ncbi:MAG: hypothetical protein GX573_12765 [Chloroflexi bacterium]|nr:hypothetical protein [Chloroflexota bacterium]
MSEAVWKAYKEGITVGQGGTENGVIILDDEHIEGARITLERDGYTPFAITCGIYGWFVHTRFFGMETKARQAFEDMKRELDRILGLIPDRGDPEAETKLPVVIDAITDFVAQFP